MYLHAIEILQGYISLRDGSQPTTKATGCEILLYLILNSAMREGGGGGYLPAVGFCSYELQILVKICATGGKFLKVLFGN